MNNRKLATPRSKQNKQLPVQGRRPDMTNNVLSIVTNFIRIKTIVLQTAAECKCYKNMFHNFIIMKTVETDNLWKQLRSSNSSQCKNAHPAQKQPIRARKRVSALLIKLVYTLFNVVMVETQLIITGKPSLVNMITSLSIHGRRSIIYKKEYEEVCLSFSGGNKIFFIGNI